MEGFSVFLRERFKKYKSIAEYCIVNDSLYRISPKHTDFTALTTSDKNNYNEYIEDNFNEENPSDFQKNHIAHKEQFYEYLEFCRMTFPEQKVPTYKIVQGFAQTELKFKEQLILFINKTIEKHYNFEDIQNSENSERPDNNLYRDFELCYKTFIQDLKAMQMIEIRNNNKEFLEKTEEDLKIKLENRLKLKETFEKFIKIKEKEVKVDTVVLYRGSFNFLYEKIGEDFDIRRIDKKMAINIQELVIDKNLGTKKDSDETIANKTINRYINNYSSLFKYLIKIGEVEKDPFSGLRLKESKKISKTKRVSYNKKDINKILNYEITSKTEAKTIRKSAFWFPKIAFYTGMRLNEISELNINDFVKSNDVDFIHLFDKDLKNENAERRIPIHSELIKYGILDFVEETRKSKSKLLFSDLRNRKMTQTIKKDGWAITLSKWFNGALFKNLEIIKLEEGWKKLDFHAIRTTVLSDFKRNGLNAYIVKQIAGHGKDDVTFDDYASETNTKITELKRIIETIKY